MTALPAAVKLPVRGHFARAAEWLAVAVAVSLPWSTSASGILIALWLLALLPTLTWAGLRNTIPLPAAGILVLLLVLAVLGMAWGGASLSDQMGSLKTFLRLLVIPLLFIQYRHSDRGMWVVMAFIFSCTALLAVSWFFAIFFPSFRLRPFNLASVPVKDYIIQSGEFIICAFALVHLAIGDWREKRRGRAFALLALALAFLANHVFVVTARSTLVIFAALLPLLAFQRFNWKGVFAVLLVGTTLAGAAWMSSPYLRERVLAVADEIRRYQNFNEDTSSGFRLEFWKKSIRFIGSAPVLGNGTGTVRDLFAKTATGEGGPTSVVTDNPHNQTFLVAIQLGLIGTVLLFALWMSHVMLFRGSGLVAWLGTGVVVQNIVACLFNSYLAEFTLGWIYIFGVGVLGGMVLRGKASEAPDSEVASVGERR